MREVLTAACLAQVAMGATVGLWTQHKTFLLGRGHEIMDQLAESRMAPQGYVKNVVRP